MKCSQFEDETKKLIRVNSRSNVSIETLKVFLFVEMNNAKDFKKRVKTLLKL